MTGDRKGAALCAGEYKGTGQGMRSEQWIKRQKRQSRRRFQRGRDAIRVVGDVVDVLEVEVVRWMTDVAGGTMTQ